METNVRKDEEEGGPRAWQHGMGGGYSLFTILCIPRPVHFSLFSQSAKPSSSPASTTYNGIRAGSSWWGWWTISLNVVPHHRRQTRLVRRHAHTPSFFACGCGRETMGGPAERDVLPFDLGPERMLSLMTGT